MTFLYLSKAVARKPLRVGVCQELGSLVQTCWLMDFDAWYASFAQILFNLFRRVHTLCKEWYEHNGQDVKVQSGMLDTN